MGRPRPTEPDELLALQTIHKSLEDRGFPPSQREIAAVCGWRSPSQANNLLRLMEAKGLIDLAPGIPRGLRVTVVGAKMVADTVAV